jgi:peptidoglycan/xylan/chitin deacetylase (PgdA/CDA1 family)
VRRVVPAGGFSAVRENLDAARRSLAGEHMSLLLLAYHRVTHATPGNLHHLPAAQFQAQMHRLCDNSHRVSSWREFASAASAPAAGGLSVGVTFDDGCDSDIECARLLHSLGRDALFFIATSYLGSHGYLSSSGVTELQRLGMGIGSHGHTHVHLASLPDEQLSAELTHSKSVLEDLIQAPVEHLSFPGGSYNARVLDRARAAGYRYFYTSDWGVNAQRQHRLGVFRRSSLVNSLELDQFDALLSLRHYYARQLGFHGKELAKRTLGDAGYSRLRRTLLNLVR